MLNAQVAAERLPTTNSLPMNDCGIDLDHDQIGEINWASPGNPVGKGNAVMLRLTAPALQLEIGYPRPDRLRCRRLRRANANLPVARSQPHPVSRSGVPCMVQSHVVDIDGRFVGAAVRLSDGYRFVAVDVRLDELDGSVWPTLAEVHRNARLAFVISRNGALRPATPGRA